MEDFKTPLIKWLHAVPHLRFDLSAFDVGPRQVEAHLTTYIETLIVLACLIITAFITSVLVAYAIELIATKCSRKHRKNLLKDTKRRYKILAAIALIFGVVCLAGLCVGSIRNARQVSDALTDMAGEFEEVLNLRDHIFKTAKHIDHQLSDIQSIVTSLMNTSLTDEDLLHSFNSIHTSIHQARASDREFIVSLNGQFQYSEQLESLDTGITLWLVLTVVMFVALIMSLFGMMHMLSAYNHRNSKMLTIISNLTIFFTITLIGFQAAGLVLVADVCMEPQQYLYVFASAQEDAAHIETLQYYLYCGDENYTHNPLADMIRTSRTYQDDAYQETLTAVQLAVQTDNQTLITLVQSTRDSIQSTLFVTNDFVLELNCDNIYENYMTAFDSLCGDVMRRSASLNLFDALCIISFVIMCHVLPASKEWKQEGFKLNRKDDVINNAVFNFSLDPSELLSSEIRFTPDHKEDEELIHDDSFAGGDPSNGDVPLRRTPSPAQLPFQSVGGNDLSVGLLN